MMKEISLEKLNMAKKIIKNMVKSFKNNEKLTEKFESIDRETLKEMQGELLKIILKVI